METDSFLRALKCYPPFERPFVRHPSKLSSNEVSQNLAHLESCQLERLKIVINFLKKFEIAIAPDDLTAVQGNGQALQDLLIENLPKIHQIHKKYFKSRKLPSFGAPGYKNEYVVYSFLQDLSILIFFAARAHYGPSIHWGIVNDLLEDDELSNDGLSASDMDEYNSIVLRGIRDKYHNHTSYINLEGLFAGFPDIFIAVDPPSPMFSLLTEDLDQIFQDYNPMK